MQTSSLDIWYSNLHCGTNEYEERLSKKHNLSAEEVYAKALEYFDIMMSAKKVGKYPIFTSLDNIPSQQESSECLFD